MRLNSLISLISTASLTVEYDTQMDCLFMQLHNRRALTGTSIEAIWARVAASAELPKRCLVHDNLPATGLASYRLPWLTDYLLPKLHQAGIREWLWVCQPTGSSYGLLEQVRYQVPSLKITTFCDVEQASTWVRRTHRPERHSRPAVTAVLQPAHWRPVHSNFLSVSSPAA